MANTKETKRKPFGASLMEAITLKPLRDWALPRGSERFKIVKAALAGIVSLAAAAISIEGIKRLVSAFPSVDLVRALGTTFPVLPALGIGLSVLATLNAHGRA